MLSIQTTPTLLCDRVNRRELIRVGGLSGLGLSLPALLAQRTHASASSVPLDGSFGKAKRCIVLFLLGGPPQHETWDPKPGAPAEIRGEFKPISSATPGLTVGELMPQTARLTQDIAVLRAMSSNDNAHSASGYWMLTGKPHLPKNTENARVGPPNDWPGIAAVVKHLRGDAGRLPASVRLPEEIWNTGRIVWPGQGAGWLGYKAEPWLLTCDPNSTDFKVPDLALPADTTIDRIHRRRSLLTSIDRHMDSIQQSSLLQQWNGFGQKAFDLLSSPESRKAFAIESEPKATRDRYGRNRFGQSVLLARRLIESGVSLVQVNWTRWKDDQSVAPAWDTHAKNGERLKNALMPPMDLAYSALLEDLKQRGLLEETLVVWMGEFGRTPKINARGGRDHWGHVYSVALAGAGVQGGAVHGSSDKQGAFPASGVVEPSDLAATIFHCLGYDAHTQIVNQEGRPMAITHGTPVHEILS